MILDNKNSSVDNSYLKSMGNYSKYSLEYPEKKKNKLSEEVDKSSINSVVIKDASLANNRHFRMNPDKESSNIRDFEFLKNDNTHKYLQHSMEGKRYGSSQESAKSDPYSVVTIAVSNTTKSDIALGLDYENSKNVDEEDSSKSLNSSDQQTEPLDLTVQKFQNDINSAELKSIDQSLSISQDVLSLNSSSTEKNPSKISVDELIQNIILDSLDFGKKPQVTRIAANESKASILEAEVKSKKDLQREPMNDLNKSSVELSDSVYIPSVLTNGNNLGSTISSENKSSNITEKESLSSNILTMPPNINGTVPKATFKADKISSEKTLPDPKTLTSSHNIAPNIDSSLLPKDLARELCFDFLHFTTKWNTYQKDLENKLTKGQSEMETLIKNTAKICRKIEDVSVSTSQEKEEAKKSFFQLQYLILTASSKLVPFFSKASDMQKDFQSLHTSMEQYNNGVDMRLARIFSVICEKK
ncbi:hypothetical protein TNCT_662791 [Trichonephila clavata]|uniref:Uncharacterized protein n=1 Tax=Trichonephila clavata TaxID=2740835 RepID=A0A8X6FVW7_TRICU|nr:hypothetical protein TNCT_662791 [Trichonephila clavata]